MSRPTSLITHLRTPPPPPITLHERATLVPRPGYYVLDPTAATDGQEMHLSVTSRDPKSQVPPNLDDWEAVTTIEVGEPKADGTRERYSVHTHLLSKSSRFFEACLNPRSGMVEAARHHVDLPEIESAVFSYFVQWIYNGSLSHHGVEFEGVEEKDAKAILEELTTGPKKKEPKKEIGFFHLVKLWKLAGFLQAERLRNEIIDEVARLSTKHNAVFGPEDTQMLWGDEENEIAGLKVLVVDLFAGMKTTKLVREAEDSWNERFMRELVVKMKNKLDLVPGVPFVKEWKDATLRCAAYHVHFDTKKCELWIKDM